jgi:geranylgeranyl transferase type-2 subunit alpha
MFHGVKRSEVKELTEEEKKKNELQLKKLKAIQDQILKIKAKNKYDEKSMEFLLKSSVLMPDYPTLWSIRKILIEQYLPTIKEEEAMTFLLKEIKSILPIMMKNPKSYLLWYHRVWCLVKCIEIEIKKDIPLEKSVLIGEIGLCNKFFAKDDRNFHCWNYRVKILSLISIYFQNTFQKFIEDELKFTLEKITLNFSNFSAWLYRSKLIPIYFIQHNIKWNTKEALEFFKEDLELIKKAIYTDPKDQSPWNYLSWIITNFSPLYVKDINLDENNILRVKYSNVFKINSLLEILGKPENFEILNKEEFSSEIKIQIKNIETLGDEKIVIHNKQIDKINIGIDGLSLVTNKICFTKENLTLPTVTAFKGERGKLEYKIEMDNVQDFQLEFLNSQLEVIKELIKVSQDFFIENGHAHLANLYKIFYEIHRRSCKDEEKEKAKEDKKNEIEELKLLQQKSKRMNTMYSSLLSMEEKGN